MDSLCFTLKALDIIPKLHEHWATAARRVVGHLHDSVAGQQKRANKLEQERDALRSDIEAMAGERTILRGQVAELRAKLRRYEQAALPDQFTDAAETAVEVRNSTAAGARHEAADTILALLDAVRALTVEREAADEEINGFREASGLLVGGDPGGVTPEHLSRFIQRQDRTVRAWHTAARKYYVMARALRDGFRRAWAVVEEVREVQAETNYLIREREASGLIEELKLPPREDGHLLDDKPPCCDGGEGYCRTHNPGGRVA